MHDISFYKIENLPGNQIERIILVFHHFNLFEDSIESFGSSLFLILVCAIENRYYHAFHDEVDNPLNLHLTSHAILFSIMITYL